MTPEIFALCVSAALLELDTTYAFQLTLSRGIIAGPLLSLWTGDLMAGIQVGVFTELLFSDVNPLGGILPPSAVVCSAVTLALHAMGIELYFAFFFGVVGAIAFSMAEKFMRKNRFKWLIFWERRVMQQPGHLYFHFSVCLVVRQRVCMAPAVYPGTSAFCVPVCLYGSSVDWAGYFGARFPLKNEVTYEIFHSTQFISAFLLFASGLELYEIPKFRAYFYYAAVFKKRIQKR